MGLKTIQKSVFNSSDNFQIGSTADFINIPEKEREGVIIVSGSAGGSFIYNPDLSQNNHNGGTIFSALATQNEEDLGCWVRVYSLNQGSLQWFGSNDNTVTNLIEAYGIEGLVVNIKDDVLGGTFKFVSAEVANHDGINNFNGWIRINDSNFTNDINMHGNRILNGRAGVADDDFATVEQARQLANGAEFLGIVPQVTPEQTADGVTNRFSSEADGTENPSMLIPQAFEVYIDGSRQIPDIPGFPNDYSIDPATGDVLFNFVPSGGSEILVIWFAPITINEFDEIPVTADNTGATHLLSEWVGSQAGAISLLKTGAVTPRTLQQRIDSAPSYFDSVNDLLVNYNRINVNSFVVLYGNQFKGDGGYSTYYVITKADADSQNIPYDANSPNILITGPGSGWVAVFQTGTEYALSFVEETLSTGQTSVTFNESIINGIGYIVGDDVDRGLLREGLDYSREPDGLTITLVESYPEGTIIQFQLPSVNLSDEEDLLRTEIVNDSNNSYSLLEEDKNKYRRMNNAGAITVTVPDELTEVINIGSSFHFTQTGAGQITVVPAAGVTINTSSTLLTRAQNSSFTLLKVGSDEWDIFGDLEI